MDAFPITIAFAAGTIFGICLMIALLKWGERRLDRDDDKDKGVFHD